MTASTTPQRWTAMPYTSRDGLRLHARRYPAESRSVARPVLCLAGLTRNANDFELLAQTLSTRQRRPRDVYGVDYRGRGRSEHDRNWRNYTPYLEMLDVLDFMTLAGLHGVAVIGTSRGGIIAMQMAAVRPGAIGVAVLNDIGPELQTAGLARIIGYAGRTPLPATWDEATEIVRRMNGAMFTAVREEEWPEIARLSYLEGADGQPEPSYDPRIAKSLGQIDMARPLPSMWPQFKALTRAPTLVLRGENSDLLSKDCLAAMHERQPSLHSLEVEGQGHAPLLRDAETIEALAAFLDATDAA